MSKLYIKNSKLFSYAILIAILVTILDLYSKNIIFSFLENKINYSLKITNFFNLVTVYNRGVSFGLFDNIEYSVFILATLGIIITIILIIWLGRINQAHIAIALGLIIGGAMGNIIDRIVNGAVADFLDFHIANYHWPAFNLADSAITIGAIILILDELILTRKNKNHDQ